MVLKAAGIVIVLINELLIVGDSVMGCFVQAPRDGDASPGVVSYNQCQIVVRVIGLSRECNNLTGRFLGPFLPARRPVLPCAMSEERDIFWSRLRSLNRYSDFALF